MNITVVLIVGLIIVKKRTAVNNLLPAKLLPDPSFRIPLGDDEQTIFKTLMQNRFHLAVRHDHSLAEIAHLVAHRCHNPKVVSLMMIFNIVVDSGAPTIWQKGSRNFDSQNFKLRVSTPVTLSLGAAVLPSWRSWRPSPVTGPPRGGPPRGAPRFCRAATCPCCRCCCCCCCC